MEGGSWVITFQKKYGNGKPTKHMRVPVSLDQRALKIRDSLRERGAGQVSVVDVLDGMAKMLARDSEKFLDDMEHLFEQPDLVSTSRRSSRPRTR